MASPIHRLFSRLSPQLRQHALRRGLTTTARRNAASNFLMPALSPTMTEGTISSWKLKEGDTFSAGDVLLEIETDKAQMDVEAPDDGVLAKIMVKASAKAVQVGSRIAVLAEPGDDLAGLEVPPEKDSKSGSGTPASGENVDEENPRKDTGSPRREHGPSVVESSVRSAPDTAMTGKVYTHSPGVAHLIREHRISEGDASAITTTGPKGRLLKGDILAHLGRINKAHPRELEERIHKLQKLDLSNIKIAPPKKDVGESAKKATEKLDVDRERELKLEVSFGEVLKAQNKLQAALGIHLPLSTFISKATTRANHSLPPVASASDILDELLNLPSMASSRPAKFQPAITALPLPSPRSPTASADILDMLTGAASATTPAVKRTLGIAATGPNVISLTVKSAEEEERGRLFLEKLKSFLEKDPVGLVL
ncbi:unnamed protein product [Tuber aestivum]|uniref:Dihydrolipoamide acetyltransferase component of pyruvate dehydrogenase complex n=1 Tax=Tuber aestivum TaxID=59557 RepID=A0A292PXF2_9PEZI|nr:unnamed protein product [Tuber aestivum]